MQALLPTLCEVPRHNPGMKDQNPPATLGARLKVSRERAEMTQNEVAEKLGFTSHSPIGQWERGDVLPEYLNLVACAEGYGVSLDWLVWGMGYNFDERVAALPEMLRIPLVDRIERELDDAEKLAKRLGPTFSSDPIQDADPRLRKWSATKQRKRDRAMGKKR